MERYSNFRDKATGIAPLLTVVSPNPIAGIQKLSFLLSYPLAVVRICLVILLLSLHAVLDEILSLLSLSALSRVITALLMRMVLALFFFSNLKIETVRLVKTTSLPAFSPAAGDLIVSNHSSPLDLIYLAYAFNPVFLLPISAPDQIDPAKITSYRSCGLIEAILNCGKTPERSRRGMPLEAICSRAKRPLALFPECTTSNNRALLRFGSVGISSTSKKLLRVFLLSFKYEIPTAFKPSATLPLPSSTLSPLPHLFNLAVSLVPQELGIKRLNPSESPTISFNMRPAEMQVIAETLSAVGRWKSTAIDWESKVSLQEIKKKKR